ncbi:904_t:CDS:1, partial [Entrophospora sp. SA101]
MLELEKFSSLNMNDGRDHKIIDIITVLLIGSTGSGKSTLANVISGSDDFDVGHHSVRSTKDTNVHHYVIDGKLYKIVDTVGIGNTRMSSKDVLTKLAIAAEVIKYEINQILFVSNGRFTDIEIDALETLESVIFDKSIFEYTTIVRTNFPDFIDDAECEKDYQAMISKNDKLSLFVKSCKSVIHIDNPPITKRTKQFAEESRKRLLNYLKTCTKVYVPEKLQEMMVTKIGDYMTHKKSLQKGISWKMDDDEIIKKLRED